MKERLTGAIILVALIVLLVPELLTGPPRAAVAPAALGSSEEPPLKSYTINLADDARQKTANGSSPPMPQANGPAMPQVGSAQPVTPAQSNELPVPAPGPPRGARSPGTEHQSDTSALDANAPTAGAPGVVSAPQKAAPRAAASERSRAHQSGTSSAASAHSASQSSSRGASAGSGWVVQLGVFANRQNAEHLAQEMRNRGFRTGVSELGASGRKLYRVRVGPAADRAAAQELQNRLRAAGRSGTIVPYS